MWESEPELFCRGTQFFAFAVDCHPISSLVESVEKTSGFLADTSWLTEEEHFADVAIGWHEEGVKLEVVVHQPIQRCFYPQLTQGDAIEFFLDTRDLKMASLTSRFCHHFFFLPEPVEEVQRGELTRFRGEDRHPLAAPEEFICDVHRCPKSYHMTIFLPAKVLFGYDPSQFQRLGFSYRIHRFQGKPQHFTVCSPDFSIPQQPSLWATLRLVK